jgi:hypothetical protein
MASLQFLQAFRKIREAQKAQVVSKGLAAGATANKPNIFQKLMGRPMETAPEQPMMGDETPTQQADKSSKNILGTLAITGAVVSAGRTYTSSIGDLTANKAAENATGNFLTKTGYLTGIGGATYQAAKLGAKLGPVGAAIAATTVLATSAMVMSIENEKLIMRIENRQAQSVKDQQRLGYISYSKGR